MIIIAVTKIDDEKGEFKKGETYDFSVDNANGRYITNDGVDNEYTVSYCIEEFHKYFKIVEIK